ncbi:MAG: hypothetical protein AAGF76_01125 [Pseudomonadota bacterium]
MNQLSAYDKFDVGVEEDAEADAMPPMTYKIMRSGQRPLVFEGMELCMAMSYVPASPYWFEINIYRSSSQKFVAAVRTFFQAEEERDRARAWECDSFDGVMDVLERYDAASDLRVDAFADAHDLSALELAGLGFTLMARAKAARDQYHGLLGEILHELDA